MEKEIITLALSKLSGYIATALYLGFFGLAFINEWLAMISLVLAIIAAIVKLYYEMSFTYLVLKK